MTETRRERKQRVSEGTPLKYACLPIRQVQVVLDSTPKQAGICRSSATVDPPSIGPFI